jgi:hypothetical protein
VKHTHEGLQNQTKYYYSAFTYDVCFNYSAAETTSATPQPSSAVFLSNFWGTVVDNGVLLEWVTVFEVDHVGFNVYRKTHESESFQKISQELVKGTSQYQYLDQKIVWGASYLYSIGAVDRMGDEVIYGPIQISISDDSPRKLTLSQNYPNPFNPATTIRFALPRETSVNLSVYDIKGRQVVTLVDRVLPKSFAEVAWDGTDAQKNPVNSGVYFYRLKAGKKTLTKKMVVLK